MIAIAEAWV